MPTEKRQHYFLFAFNLFTIALWVWALLEFFSKGATEVTVTFANIYLLILAYYAGDKEVRRWRRRHEARKRRGELFVYGWVATALLLFLIEVLGGGANGYQVPRQLPYIAGSVAIIYLVTEVLKSEFRKR